MLLIAPPPGEAKSAAPDLQLLMMHKDAAAKAAYKQMRIDQPIEFQIDLQKSIEGTSKLLWLGLWTGGCLRLPSLAVKRVP